MTSLMTRPSSRPSSRPDLTLVSGPTAAPTPPAAPPASRPDLTLVSGPTAAPTPPRAPAAARPGSRRPAGKKTAPARDDEIAFSPRLDQLKTELAALIHEYVHVIGGLAEANTARQDAIKAEIKRLEKKHKPRRGRK